MDGQKRWTKSRDQRKRLRKRGAALPLLSSILMEGEHWQLAQRLSAEPVERRLPIIPRAPSRLPPTAATMEASSSRCTPWKLWGSFDVFHTSSLLGTLGGNIGNFWQLRFNERGKKERELNERKQRGRERGKEAGKEDSLGCEMKSGPNPQYNTMHSELKQCMLRPAFLIFGRFYYQFEYKMKQEGENKLGERGRWQRMQEEGFNCWLTIFFLHPHHPFLFPILHPLPDPCD